MRAERIERPQGYSWAVYLDPEQPGEAPAGTRQPAHNPVSSRQEQLAAAAELVALVDRLSRENVELAGRVGSLQAELQQAKERLALAGPSAMAEPAAPLRRRWWTRLLW